MHLPTALLLPLIASVTAIPAPAPAPQGYRWRHSGLPLPEKPRPQPCKDMEDTNPRSLALAKTEWEYAHTQAWLERFLDEGGAHLWLHRLFQKNINKKDRSSFDCSHITSKTCAPLSCDVYEPASAFLVHASVANLVSALNYVHESVQDSAIESLATEINSISETFGPPPSMDNYIWTLLIGIFVGGAAGAGPHWKVGAPMTGVVGALNIAAGIESAKEPPATLDYNQRLKDQLGTIYGQYMDTLHQTLEAIVSGDVKSLADKNHLSNVKVDDPKAWISGMFADGKLFSSHEVNKAAKAWGKNVHNMLLQGFVVRALRMQDYHVVLRWDIKKKDCEKGPGLNVWINDRCAMITTIRFLQGRNVGHTLSEKQAKAFTDTYKFDPKEAMQNAADCAANGGGDPKYLGWPSFSPKSTLPPCFVNLKVKEMDNHGLPPPK